MWPHASRTRTLSGHMGELERSSVDVHQFVATIQKTNGRNQFQVKILFIDVLFLIFFFFFFFFPLLQTRESPSGRGLCTAGGKAAHQGTRGKACSGGTGHQPGPSSWADFHHYSEWNPRGTKALCRVWACSGLIAFWWEGLIEKERTGICNEISLRKREWMDRVLTIMRAKYTSWWTNTYILITQCSGLFLSLSVRTQIGNGQKPILQYSCRICFQFGEKFLFYSLTCF